MALPGLSITVADGNLNIQQGSNEKVPLLMGVCTLGTPATLYSFGDTTTMQNTLGLGKLTELAGYVLAQSGGPIQVMPVNPSQQGALGAVTHVGTGAGTVTVTAAPHLAITVNCTTSGTLGTAAFTFTLGSGAASQPVTSASGWSSTGYLVPGTYTTLTFSAGSYVGSGTPDQYVISTLGVITHPQGAGPSISAQASSAIDNYNCVVTIGTGGALGTATFTYSLDNGEANLAGNGVNSSTVVTPGGGAYAIPSAGIVLTFASTFVAGDTYTFKTASAFYNATDLATCNTAIQTTYINTLTASLVGVSGNMLASAAAWATQASVLETSATTLFNNGVYLRYLNECPTVGSIFVSGGVLTVDSADTDSVIATAAAAVTSAHTMASAGDCLLTSPISGLTLRRSSLWPTIARAASIEASRNPGDVSLGGVPSVSYLFRDEQKTPALDAARFNTLRTFPGLPGFYITDFHTMALSTSDYGPGMNARVVDRACGITRFTATPLVNSKIPVKNDGTGRITEKKAQQIEGRLDSALATGLVDSDPADAVAAGAVVNRSNNVLSSANVQITVGVVPFAYGKTISVTIGMSTKV